jgi:hypothetical protein
MVLGLFPVNAARLGDIAPTDVQIRDWVWPPRCGKDSVKSTSEGLRLEATKPGNGKPEVAPPAAGDSHLRPQPRRGGEGVARIRNRIEHFSRRRSSRRSPFLAALGAGFAGNSQRPVGFRQFLPQGFSNLARPRGSRHPRRRLPPAGPQILPSFGTGWQVGKTTGSTESYFSCVKSFSYQKTSM